MSREKHSILIIDDNASILRAFSRILAKAGYNVETAQTGKEASKKFMTKKFDAALIDISLGETKGTDLLPQMRKVAPNMLKILFTGTPVSESTLDKAKEFADFFLLKPVNPETLLGILEDEIK
jgi:DNA-binding NtrC family response regulator